MCDKTETLVQHRWQTYHDTTPREDVPLRKLVLSNGNTETAAIWVKPCTDRTVLLRHSRDPPDIFKFFFFNCANLASPQVFRGNVDNNTPYANSFTPPIKAQYVRLYPQVCRRHCTLRMELLGCELTGGTPRAPCPPPHPAAPRRMTPQPSAGLFGCSLLQQIPYRV